MFLVILRILPLVLLESNLNFVDVGLTLLAELSAPFVGELELLGALLLMALGLSS